MEANITAAEINLNLIPDQLRHKVNFNETQVLAYLGGLSTYYNEVMILSHENHLLILTVGKSSQLLLQAIRSFADDSAIVTFCKTTPGSTNLFYKIMKGERWKNINAQQLKEMLERAVDQTTLADCRGNALQKLIEQGYELIQFSQRPYTWQTRQLAVVKYPTVSDFDFEHTCLN